MKEFWRRSQGPDLEALLRAQRSEPRAEFLETLAQRIRGEARPVRSAGMRVAPAGALTLATLLAAASAGGLGYAAATVKQAAKTVQKALTGSGPGDAVEIRVLSAGGDQYRPGFGWGDPDHNHTGPPRLRLLVAPAALPLSARATRDGKCAVVSVRLVVDEQADILVRVRDSSGRFLPLTQSRSRVGGKVIGPQTRSIRYRLLVPRAIRLALCIPPRFLREGKAYLLQKGKAYQIIFRATDPSRQSRTIRIPFEL